MGSRAGLGSKEGGRTGAGQAELSPKAGDRQRVSLVPLGPAHLPTPVPCAVPPWCLGHRLSLPREWDGAIPAGTPARAMSQAPRSAR